LDDLKQSVPRLEVRRANPLDPSAVSVGARSGVDARSVTMTRKWRTGTILDVEFADGAPQVQAQVRKIAEQWTDYANLRFDFQPSPRAGEPATIRISFKEDNSSWSFIGTDCLHVPANQPTMSLGILKPESDQQEYSKFVLHEFGHALGLIHEHQNPNADIPWAKDAVLKYYGESQGWSPESVTSEILKKYEGDYREFDPKSIMMYQFPAQLFRGDFEIGINSILSKSDKEFIGKLYPPDSKAVNLVVGTSVLTGTIARAGQTMYYTFYAPTKSHYTIEAGGPARVICSVFGPDSRTDHVASGAIVKPDLSVGIYHLTVKHADVRGTGTYALKITRDKTS
jgi:hypothetical protein